MQAVKLLVEQIARTSERLRKGRNGIEIGHSDWDVITRLAKEARAECERDIPGARE